MISLYGICRMLIVTVIVIIASIKSQKTVRISGDTSSNKIFFARNTEQIHDPQRRQLPLKKHQSKRSLLTTARKRLLVIRVTSITSGESPNESIESIQGAIFGYGPNPDNILIPDGTVVSQYAAISHQQLLYEPINSSATNPTLTIHGGVWDLQIQNVTFSNNSISDITSTILQQAEEYLSSDTVEPGASLLDIADHIIFCLPNGSVFNNNSNWTAFSYINQPYSYYQLSRCTKLSVVMHEIGHSLGFQHSGYGESMYGDKTGYMGYSSNEFGYPRKAFNGHKHWMSGWFSNRMTVVDPSSGPIEMRLVSFVHYSDGNEMDDTDVVLIRFRNLYIQYNRAKMYNVDTDVPNKVTITHAVSDDDVSERYAALSEGEKFSFSLYDENRVLVIQVCSMVQYETSQLDYAVLRFYYDDGEIDFSACSTKYVPPSISHHGSNTSTTDSSVSTNNGMQQNKPTNPIIEYDDDNIVAGSNDTLNKRLTNDEMFFGIIILPTILVIFAGIFILYWIRQENIKDTIMIYDVQQSKSPTPTLKQCKQKPVIAHHKDNKNTMNEEIDETAQEDENDDHLFVYL